MATIEQVKNYWEKNTPQYWYSKKEVGTREYYDEIQTHRYSVVYPYLPELVEFHKHAGKKVLEVGCGQGTDLLQFAKAGAEVHGIDLTEAAVQKARQMFDTYGLPAHLQSMNSEDMHAFEDETFDVVYSFGVIHHTPNTEKAVSEIWRVLKPGGKLYLMIYSKGFNFLVRFFLFHVGKGHFLHQDLQSTINQYTEYRRNSPLTKMYTKRQARTLLKDFRDLELFKRHNHHLIYRVPRSVQEPFGKVLGDNLFIRCVK
jgi:2-polyprenyl-3-methyl-5-hydroxy-6-metoxy-1,4-benzoquinol methylase